MLCHFFFSLMVYCVRIVFFFGQVMSLFFLFFSHGLSCILFFFWRVLCHFLIFSSCSIVYFIFLLASFMSLFFLFFCSWFIVYFIIFLLARSRVLERRCFVPGIFLFSGRPIDLFLETWGEVCLGVVMIHTSFHHTLHRHSSGSDILTNLPAHPSQDLTRSDNFIDLSPHPPVSSYSNDPNTLPSPPSCPMTLPTFHCILLKT